MTHKMKIGTHSLSEKGKKQKRFHIDYRRVSATNIDASLDRMFGGAKKKFKCPSA
jgi:hypothetical protein